MTQAKDSDTDLAGKRIAFVGKLGGMTRREARQLLREIGAVPVAEDDVAVDIVVLGAEEMPLQIGKILPESLQQAAAEQRLEVILETELWHRLDLMEQENFVRQLYTPAMLAELVGVPLATIRRWHRRGLIVPAREVHRLPFFDFQEVATARQLAQLLDAGASPAAIEKELALLSQFVPEVERPLAQLAVIIEGKQLLLRQGEGLVEPGGQRRFDFDAVDVNDTTGDLAGDGLAVVGRSAFGDAPGPVSPPTDDKRAALAGTQAHAQLRFEGEESPTVDELLAWAIDCEDAGEVDTAINAYRLIMAITGPHADWNFRIAELLYRGGDITAARERYYMTVELDEDFVEARANLGCVLAELGQMDLAIAAFEGALGRYAEYPDVHYHLARTLDDVDRAEEAREHWERFLAFAAASPWADEARERLGLLDD
ncbi:MAG: MerR family transcriptional regulator [Planctomycetales bacterium]|nr:MerR family transcriptional regulator [Planctomycetales bacterium]